MEISFWAMLVAAIAAFVVGALWYSPLLFANVWIKAKGFTEGDISKAKEKNMVPSYLAGFVINIVTAVSFAFFISIASASSFNQIVFIGFMLWIGFMVPIFFDNKLWDMKDSWVLFFINSFYRLAALLVMSLVFFLF
mgnify:CR=1 FL=1